MEYGKPSSNSKDSFAIPLSKLTYIPVQWLLDNICVENKAPIHKKVLTSRIDNMSPFDIGLIATLGELKKDVAWMKSIHGLNDFDGSENKELI